MIVAARPSTRFVTNTTARPVLDSGSKLTTMRT